MRVKIDVQNLGSNKCGQENRVRTEGRFKGLGSQNQNAQHGSFFQEQYVRYIFEGLCNFVLIKVTQDLTKKNPLENSLLFIKITSLLGRTNSWAVLVQSHNDTALGMVLHFSCIYDAYSFFAEQ